ncbi:MAG: arginase family protein, partial [Candidatus Hydrogenedens sp.]
MISAQSDIGGRIRGPADSFDAFKKLAKRRNSKIFETIEYLEVKNDNCNLLPKDPFAKFIQEIFEFNTKLCSKVQESLESHNRLIVISGDHSSAIGIIAGIKTAFPNKRLGVIWMDAHADIHSPFTTPSGNMHGMPLGCSLGEDNFDHYKNKPDQETIEYWNKLKHIGNICPKIFYQDLVYIGLRSYEEEEAYLLVKNNIKIFTVSDV